MLPDIAALGFDIVYLPPVHPIGETNRKGRNNAEKARKGDPGSPWAIGGPPAATMRSTAISATMPISTRWWRQREAAGIELAIDFAIQMSPDHPWLTEHPEWFNRRPDGTLKFAENPPKRYQDIHNIDWDTKSGRHSGTPSRTSCSAGARGASSFSASTTRTRSRCRSGSG